MKLLFGGIIAIGAVIGVAGVSRTAPTPLPVMPPRLMSIPEQVVSIAIEVGVPPALATQLASVESGMNPAAVHREGNGASWGVMMLNDRFTTLYLGTGRQERYWTDANIRTGLIFLRTQLARCHGDWACAVARYQGRWRPGMR